MKKIILCLLFCCFLTSPIFAEDFQNLYDETNINQNSTTESTSEETTTQPVQTNTTSQEEYLLKHFYTVKIIKGSQSAFNKYVPLILEITPNETPVKTQITWDIPDNMNIHIQHSEFITSLKKGETYQFKAKVKPLQPGTYEITANVTAWLHDSNYTSSASILITFNDNLVVDPNDTNYKISIALKTLLILLTIGGIGYGIYIGWGKLTKFLKDYLKPPEL